MFTELATNFKGTPVRAALGKYNAVTGENRSGKTALLRAIRLACSPKPPAAQAQRYYKLAPNNDDEAYARLYQGPEVVASFIVCKDSKGKVRAPVQAFEGPMAKLTDEQLDRLMPTVAYRDLIDLGDAKAREELFRRFGQINAGAKLPIPIGVAGDALRMWNQGLAAAAVGKTDPAEVLSALGEWMRKEKKRLSDEVRTRKKSNEELSERVQTIIAGAELLPGLEAQYERALRYENLSMARAGLEQAKIDRDGIAAERVKIIGQQTEHKAQRAKSDARIAELRELIAAQRNERAQLLERSGDLLARVRRLDAFQETIEAQAQRGCRTCALCDTSEVSEARQRELESLRALRGGELESMQRLQREMDSKIYAAESEIRQLESAASTLEATLRNELASCDRRADIVAARIKTLVDAMRGVETYEGPSSADVKKTIEDMQNGLSLRRQLEESEVMLRQQKAELELAKELEDKAEQQLETLLKQVAVGAEAAINKYMPVGFIAKLELGGGVCRWSVLNTKDGEPSDKDVWCGAEKASLTVALALAWTEGAPVRIVLLDDEDLGPFHSSPANLQAMLLALKSAVDDGHLTQVFVAGVRPDEVPAGWTTISR